MNEFITQRKKLQSFLFRINKETDITSKEVKMKFNEISSDLFNNWFLLYQGEKAFQNNEYSLAKKLALDVLDSNNEDLLAKAEGNALLGRIARLHRLFEDALRFFNKAENFFDSENDEFGNLRMRYNKANILLIKSNLVDAKVQYNNILIDLDRLIQSAPEIKGNSLKASIIQNIAIINMYQGELTEAENSFKKARELLLSSKETEKNSLANLLLNYANLARALEKRDLIKSLLQGAYNIYNELKEVKLKSKVFIDLIRDEIIFDQKLPTDPLLQDKILDSWNITKSTEAEVRMEEIITGLYNIGSKDMAIELANNLVSDVIDITTQGKLLYLFAKDSLFHGDFQKTIDLCNQVQDICKSVGDNMSYLGVESTKIIALYSKNKNYKEFVINLENNLEERKEIKDNEGIIEFLEQVYALIALESITKKDNLIIDLLTKYELPVIKKIGNKEAHQIIFADICLIYYLFDNKIKAKKTAQKENVTIDQILTKSRFANNIEDKKEFSNSFEAL
jgi:hypothetical protein